MSHISPKETPSQFWQHSLDVVFLACATSRQAQTACPAGCELLHCISPKTIKTIFFAQGAPSVNNFFVNYTSYIIALGDFMGGRLFVADAAGKCSLSLQVLRIGLPLKYAATPSATVHTSIIGTEIKTDGHKNIKS